MQSFVLKKYFAIFLFISLAAPFAGTYAWLHWQKREIRKEIKHRLIGGMDKSALALIKLSRQAAATALRWEHEREFEYRGKMYDVVEKGVINDTLWYRCWPDDAETLLNKKLDRLLAGALEHDPQRRETERQFIQFYKSLYFTEICLQPVIFYPKSIVQPVTDRCFYYRFNDAPQSPPPEIA